VVTEARARRQRGETPGPDRWRADLQPGEVVRARVIPGLERERDLLRARLAEVRSLQQKIIFGTLIPISDMFDIFDTAFLRRWRRKIWRCTVRSKRTWR
jgi:hypothetical protein